MNPSHIPLSGKLVKAIIGNFCQKPIQGDDTWEHMSIGIAQDSLVATDTSSAIMIGTDGEGHVATQRKEALLEAERSSLYGDPVRIDEIDRNCDPAMLQRRFSIGFMRAKEFVDRMEANGIVGPQDGPRPRKVLEVATGG